MLKKIAPILFLLFLLPSIGFASTDLDSLMVKANKLYQNKNYDEAIKVYKTIINNGYVGSSLYYNLGNAYFRENKLGYAILDYEKALKLTPDDDDIKYNLKIANARTIDKIQEVPQLFIVKWWNILVAALSISGWLTIVLFFYILLLVSIGFFVLVKNFNIQREAFIAGVISFTALIIVTIILIARVNLETSSNYGILLNQSQVVKASPDRQSKDAFVIHEGIKFKIEDELNNWTEIKLSDGKVGWIPKSSFGKI